MKTALITTTIRVPRNLEGYFANAAAHGHRDIEAIVIGDNKTPTETGAFLAKLADDTGYATHWWDVERQKAWLKATDSGQKRAIFCCAAQNACRGGPGPAKSGAN